MYEYDDIQYKRIHMSNVPFFIEGKLICVDKSMESSLSFVKAQTVLLVALCSAVP